MRSTGISRGFFLSIVFWSGAASAQTLPTAARIESVPLELTMPERYHVAEVLEPIRKVTLVAAGDGLIRSIEGRLGEVVRETQEIAQIDRTESAAKLKMATAELHEKQALLKANKNSPDVYQAQVEAAEARVELAQIELDRCTLRAPFSGRLVALNVCTGQYVLKGTAIAELADVSSLKVMQPLDRRSVNASSAVTVQVEGRDVAAKVQAILPLPESLRVLRELATPFGAATLIVPNSKGELEPGLRVQSPNLPSHAIATVPKRAVKPEDSRGGENMMVQVIRDEYVTNVPVRVLGENGTERVQISGALRPADSLIASSSVPLLAGTLVRFGENGTGNAGDSNAATPASGGAEAGVTGTAGPRARSTTTGTPANSATSKRRQQGRSAAGGSPF